MNIVMKMVKFTLNDLPAWAQRLGAVNTALTEKWGGKLVQFAYKTGDFEYPIEDRQMQIRFVFDYKGCSYIHGRCLKHNDIRSYAMRAGSMHIGRGETCALTEVVKVAA